MPARAKLVADVQDVSWMTLIAYPEEQPAREEAQAKQIRKALQADDCAGRQMPNRGANHENDSLLMDEIVKTWKMPTGHDMRSD